MQILRNMLPRLASAVLAQAGAALAWNDLGLPESGFVTALGSGAQGSGDSATLYAGTAQGRVFRSTDGGRSWQAAVHLSFGKPFDRPAAVRCIVAVGSQVLMG